MRLNETALRDSSGKLIFIVREQWQGLKPESTYAQQADAVSRALDSVEYIERAVGRGSVVMAHKDPQTGVTLQMVSVETLDGLNEYLKSNEAHARLPLTNRAVLPLSDWDESVKVFNKMLARAEVRAKYEAANLPQPNQDRLDLEANQILVAAEAEKALSIEITAQAASSKDTAETK